MLVGRWMTTDPVTTKPDTPVAEAQAVMREKKIHHLPVVDKEGRMIGIVTEKDLVYASPSPATSLSMYELNYLLARLNVAKVMSREVVAVDVNTPLEEAARLMADHDIGGLPVTQEDNLVGIITESDVFRLFVELFAARQKGVRLTAVFPDVRGELAKVSAAIAEAGGDILAFGTVHEEETDKALGAIKVSGIDQEKLVALVEPFVDRLVDVREV